MMKRKVPQIQRRQTEACLNAGERKRREMDIAWIIFDAMGVIFPVGDDVNHLLIPFIRTHNPQITADEINALYFEASLGRISSMEFWKRCNIPGVDPKDLEHSYLNFSLDPDPMFFPAAETLMNRGFRLAMMSNDVGEWSAFLRRRFGLDDIFEFSFISGDLGIRKPDTRIYQHALKKLGCRPENCLYIDDKVENLLPAKELGMRVIRFTRWKAAAQNAEDIQEITGFGDLLDVL